MNLNRRFSLYPILVIGMLLSACNTTRPVIEGDFTESNISGSDVVADIPNYSEELTSLEGKGRAIISEPGNSDRVTIDFQADQKLSLLTIQNRIGIEGGQMLVDQDSILIYNRVDKIAQKVSIYDGRLTSLNELASINILDLINFKVNEQDVRMVLESNKFIQLRLKNGTRVFVDKEQGLVREVEQPSRVAAPYSKIIYESYGTLNKFTLPRKITIFSADGDSRVVFLVSSLNVNPENLQLKIDIPDNIVIQRI